MKFTRLFLLACTTAALAGCITPPKSADELRTVVKGDHIGTTHDEFTVNKPFHQVADTLKKKWLSCLDQTVTVRMANGYGAANYDNWIYKPNATSKGQRMTLTLQEKRMGRQGIGAGDLPPDGFYTMLVDIDAAGANSTKINIQKVSMTGQNFESTMKQIHSWADGSNMDCPDLSD